MAASSNKVLRLHGESAIPQPPSGLRSPGPRDDFLWRLCQPLLLPHTFTARRRLLRPGGPTSACCTLVSCSPSRSQPSRS